MYTWVNEYISHKIYNIRRKLSILKTENKKKVVKMLADNSFGTSFKATNHIKETSFNIFFPNKRNHLLE